LIVYDLSLGSSIDPGAADPGVRFSGPGTLQGVLISTAAEECEAVRVPCPHGFADRDEDEDLLDDALYVWQLDHEREEGSPWHDV
jgi:hypothetical protein